MKTRAIIQDLTDPQMPTVTEMVITNFSYFGGEMIRFAHPDGTDTVISMLPGWDLTVETTDD